MKEKSKAAAAPERRPHGCKGLPARLPEVRSGVWSLKASRGLRQSR